MANYHMLPLVDQKSKDLVYGYVKSTMSNVHVPTDIMEMCLLFYYMFDQWDTERLMDSAIKIEGNRVQKINGTRSVNAFMRNIVDSGVHVWTFKVEDFAIDTDLKHTCRITIGLWQVNDKNEPPLEDHFSESWDVEPDTEAAGFAVTVNGWNWDLDKEKLSAGDIIEMKVDFNALKLTVTANDELRQDQPQSIEREKYRAAVNLFIEPDAISLQSYTYCPK